MMCDEINVMYENVCVRTCTTRTVVVALQQQQVVVVTTYNPFLLCAAQHDECTALRWYR